MAFFGAARRRRGLGASGAPSPEDAASASVAVSGDGGAAPSGAVSAAATGLRVAVRRRRGLGASSAGEAASVASVSAPGVAGVAEASSAGDSAGAGEVRRRRGLGFSGGAASAASTLAFAPAVAGASAASALASAASPVDGAADGLARPLRRQRGLAHGRIRRIRLRRGRRAATPRRLGLLRRRGLGRGRLRPVRLRGSLGGLRRGAPAAAARRLRGLVAGGRGLRREREVRAVHRGRLGRVRLGRRGAPAAAARCRLLGRRGLAVGSLVGPGSRVGGGRAGVGCRRPAAPAAACPLLGRGLVRGRRRPRRGLHGCGGVEHGARGRLRKVVGDGRAPVRLGAGGRLAGLVRRRRLDARGLDELLGGRVVHGLRPGRLDRDLRRHGSRAGLRLHLLAAAARAPALALREVAQQLARQRARLAGHAGARPAEDLLGLRRVGDGGGEQGGREPAVVLAGRVHEAPRVAGVRPAARVHEQAEQPLRLRPALDRVLLVHLAGVLGQAPDPGVGLVAAADALLGQRLQHDLRALAALVARPHPDDVDRQVERLGVLRGGDLLQRAQAQLRVAVALDGREQEAALELAGAVEVEHRPRAAPAARRDPRARQRRPHVLLAVVEELDGDPPELALEDLVPPVLVGRDGDDAPLDAHAPAAAAADRADDDRAAAVDVAVEERVQRDDRVVVLRRGMDEVDDDARLLAGMAARDAADALLVDALRRGRREVHADRRARRVPALGEQLRVDEHVDVAALVARRGSRPARAWASRPRRPRP